jgi:hypothetical protein
VLVAIIRRKVASTIIIGANYVVVMVVVRASIVIVFCEMVLEINFVVGGSNIIIRRTRPERR